MTKGVARNHLQHLLIFKISGTAETPIKDAIKLSLITLTAFSLTILSVCAFVEVSR